MENDFDEYAIRNCGQVFGELPKLTGARRRWYYDLDTDYGEIKRELGKFEALKEPLRVGGGIRILRQDFRVVVVSFIISANNNIKRFSKTIAQIDFANLGAYTADDWRRMGCGYRADYLVEAVRQIGGMDVKELAKFGDAELIKRLMTIKGVGRKVASCIALFCGEFHRLGVAPVDTWIRKAIAELGGVAGEILSHRYAGVAQQYIFYYKQHLGKKL